MPKLIQVLVASSEPITSCITPCNVLKFFESENQKPGKECLGTLFFVSRKFHVAAKALNFDQNRVQMLIIKELDMVNPARNICINS